MTDEPHDDTGPITGQVPALFEIHRAREGRKARNWGVFFGGLAMCAAAGIGVPALIVAGRHQDRYNRELSCRAKINNATTAVNAAIVLDFADAALAAGNGADRAPATQALTADRALAARLKPIQLQAVDLCHKNPDYDVMKGTP